MSGEVYRRAGRLRGPFSESNETTTPGQCRSKYEPNDASKLPRGAPVKGSRAFFGVRGTVDYRFHLPLDAY